MSAAETGSGSRPAAGKALSGTGRINSGQDAETVDPKHFLAFLGMVFSMFMVILDIQVVAASLAEIQAGLSASSDEIAWVQTSYLIAKVIAVPLSGFLLRAFSTRITFTVSAAGFTVMSVMCATATTIEEMIVWRALQGFIGGPMVPAVFATAFTVFPRSKQYQIGALIGLVATLGPTLGPTIGGVLTDLLSWHWVFLVNVIPGTLIATVSWFLVDFDEPDLKLLDNFDWWGLAGMAAMLGSLQFTLQEGPREDWFDSQEIRIAAVVMVVGGVVFFRRALTAANPIVDLRAYLDRNFWTGSLLGFVIGIGLHGLTYLYPIYLAGVRDYSAMDIGLALFVTGLSQFLMAPIAGRLTARVDLRILIGIGLAGFAAGTWLASGVTRDWDFNELIVPQILRGASLMLCIASINQIGLGTLPPSMLKNASALYTLMRNLGGAVGLALINTSLNLRLDHHLVRLRENMPWGSAEAQAALDLMTERMTALGSDAEMAAVKLLMNNLRTEATVMSFGDVFLGLTLLYLAMIGLLFIVRRPVNTGIKGGAA